MEPKKKENRDSIWQNEICIARESDVSAMTDEMRANYADLVERVNSWWQKTQSMTVEEVVHLENNVLDELLERAVPDRCPEDWSEDQDEDWNNPKPLELSIPLEDVTSLDLAHKRTEAALKRLEKIGANCSSKLPMTPEKADRIEAYLNSLGAEEKRKRLSVCIDYVSKDAAIDALINRMDFWSFLTAEEIDMLFPELAGEHP